RMGCPNRTLEAVHRPHPPASSAGELSRMAAAFSDLAVTPQLGLLNRQEYRLTRPSLRRPLRARRPEAAAPPKYPTYSRPFGLRSSDFAVPTRSPIHQFVTGIRSPTCYNGFGWFPAARASGLSKDRFIFLEAPFTALKFGGTCTHSMKASVRIP